MATTATASPGFVDFATPATSVGITIALNNLAPKLALPIALPIKAVATATSTALTTPLANDCLS